MEGRKSVCKERWISRKALNSPLSLDKIISTVLAVNKLRSTYNVSCNINPESLAYQSQCRKETCPLFNIYVFPNFTT